MSSEPEKFRKETKRPSPELGQQFITRWFAPGLIKPTEAQLTEIGDRLKTFGESYTRNPYTDCLIPRWENYQSILKLNDLYGNDEEKFRKFFAGLLQGIDPNHFRLNVGSIVEITPRDYLVTTPLDQAGNHAREATESIEAYNEKGFIDNYWRDFWQMPNAAGIGSKLWYVDRRAIRGFAVITDILPWDKILMSVDTWRWIEPIPCDYSKIKPPQRYALAINHRYLEGVGSVKIVGDWLSAMPEQRPA